MRTNGVNMFLLSQDPNPSELVLEHWHQQERQSNDMIEMRVRQQNGEFVVLAILGKAVG